MAATPQHLPHNSCRTLGKRLASWKFRLCGPFSCVALEDCVLYSSSEPCPMCLAACYRASVPWVVFAATSRDLAGYDFQDLAFSTELGLVPARATPGPEQGVKAR
jgi:tRNA(Arg) A34 adenosine deaminase TadA